MSKKTLVIFLFIFCPPSFGWFWDKPDINNLIVKFFVDDCSKMDTYCLLQRSEGGRKIQVDIKNNTEYYISFIKASCRIYDKNKNRIFNQDVIFKDEPVEISPNNSSIFYSYVEKIPTMDSTSIDCKIIEAGGTKK